MVGRQKQLGIDLPGDGEFGKSMGHGSTTARGGATHFSAWAVWNCPAPGCTRCPFTGRVRARSCSRALATGATARGLPPPITIRNPGSPPAAAPNFPVCVGPLTYTGHAAIKADIENFKAALAADGIEEGFMTSVAPGSASRIGNEYYKTDDEFLFACADAMREEYKAIIDAGLILQLDDPSIAENWDMINPEPTVEEYRAFSMRRVEALNHAIKGLPRTGSASICAGAAGTGRTPPTSRCATSST